MTKLHKKGRTMIKFIVKMSEEDTKKLQKAHVKHDTYAENMQKALENPNVNKEMLDFYQGKQEEALLAFEDAKRLVGEKYVPECLYEKHECQWTINYNTCEMEIRVLCECGREAAEEAGIKFEEV